MLNGSLFNRFRETVAQQQLGVYGVHVYQEGRGTVAHRWRSDDRTCLYSASKTFAALAVGICQEEGRLSIEDKALDFFPQYRDIASAGSEDITLRDLLHMCSGKLFSMFDVPWDSPVLRQTDWAELFFRLHVTAKPGTHFWYSNPSTYLLGRVVECVTGQNLRDYAKPRLFDKLNIFNPQWHTCPQGHTLSYSGLYLTTEELSRLGRLLLDGGVYEGKQVVNAAFVQALHEDIVDSNPDNGSDPEGAVGYGYQVWRCRREGSYRADGSYGQYSIVVPDKRAVVTITGHRNSLWLDTVRAAFSDIVELL